MAELSTRFETCEVPPQADRDQRRDYVECFISMAIRKPHFDPHFLMYHPIYRVNETGGRAAINHYLDFEVQNHSTARDHNDNFRIFKIMDTSTTPWSLTAVTTVWLVPDAPSAAAEVQETEAHWYRGTMGRLVERVLTDADRKLADRNRGRQVLNQRIAVHQAYDSYGFDQVLAKLGVDQAEAEPRETLIVTFPGIVDLYRACGYELEGDIVDATPGFDESDYTHEQFRAMVGQVKFALMSKPS